MAVRLSSGSSRAQDYRSGCTRIPAAKGLTQPMLSCPGLLVQLEFRKLMLYKK